MKRLPQTPRLDALVEQGLIKFERRDGGNYHACIATAANGQEVNLGYTSKNADHACLEAYFADHPTPDTWRNDPRVLCPGVEYRHLALQHLDGLLWAVEMFEAFPHERALRLNLLTKYAREARAFLDDKKLVEGK